MEGETAISAMYMEYVDSPATAEGCETSEGSVQAPNVDLSMRASPTSQHPLSKLETPQLIHTKWNLRPKLRSLSELVHRNWRTGLEVGILTGIILMVWALFSIPTILYALPSKIREVPLMSACMLVY